MKIKVRAILPFYDKEAKTKRKNGDVFDVTAKRFNEICCKGRYIEVVEDEAPATASKKTEK